MDSIEKKDQANLPTRRKFMVGVGIVSAFAAVSSTLGLPFWNKKSAAADKAKPKTVKMLTEDGKLVEIDGALLAASSKRVTNNELKNWIKKKI